MKVINGMFYLERSSNSFLIAMAHRLTRKPGHRDGNPLVGISRQQDGPQYIIGNNSRNFDTAFKLGSSGEKP